MRTADKADPDPELTTVSLRIWPRMLVITIADLVFLVYVAGLSGGYIFIAIFVNFLLTCVVLWKTTKVTQKVDSRDRKEQVPEEEIPMLAIRNETEAACQKAREEEESFLFAASLSSTWIPSVVGDPEQQFFLKAGEVFGLFLLCRNPLYLVKLPRCFEPRHKEFLPCRCDHPRQL